eukprot:scaffold3405_cov57-Phaeocystis_antarctica.AAC.4
MPHAQDAALTRHRTPTPHPLLTSTPSFHSLSPHLFVMQMDSKEGPGPLGFTIQEDGSVLIPPLRETFGVTIQEDGSVLIPPYGQSRLSELGRALFCFLGLGVELGLQLIEPGSRSGMVYAVLQLAVSTWWYISTSHLRNPIRVDKPNWYGMTWTSRPNPRLVQTQCWSRGW